MENGADCDERLLEVAKENLTKSFSVVGICERFEESLILIAKTLAGACALAYLRIGATQWPICRRNAHRAELIEDFAFELPTDSLVSSPVSLQVIRIFDS